MNRAVQSETNYTMLIRKVAHSSGYSMQSVREIMAATISQVGIELKDRRRVVIVGLATFDVVRTKGRNRHDINSGGTRYIEPHLKIRVRLADKIRWMFRKKARLDDEDKNKGT